MNHRANLLYPLSDFYTRKGLVLPEVSRLDEREIPQPYRSLLVHDRDMTRTLETAFGQSIRLRVLDRSVSGNVLTRQVLLMLEEARAPVEYGAIRIHLDSFSRPARGDILRGSRPLGAILHLHEVEYRSRPKAFIEVQADSLISAALRVRLPGSTLYGRLNVLRNGQGSEIAEILEILAAVEGGGDHGLRLQSP